METLTLVLLLAVSVLVSAVLNQVIPKVSLPLIQVVLGVVIALFARNDVSISLDPDLFLVVFIAPLLYIEAKNADKALLWRNKGTILSLAIGLVLVTAIAIGFSVNALVPAIPLAAAFALGGALGPTDAVAVTSISKQVHIPQRLWGMLKGELLLNDASGIVCFQFALAAVTSSTFSLLNASVTFVVEFIGGLLFGLVLGYLANFVLRKVRDLGIVSTTFHVLFEICIPFLVYLTSQAFHVSGIIAVVVAGLVNVISPRTASPEIAHMNIVSSSVWQVMSFALNGIVFVLLGTQLPTAMRYTWLSDDISNVLLIAMVAAITTILLAVRFIWCLGMEVLRCKKEGRPFGKGPLRNSAIVTLCGSKGTITLSILLTIPYYISSGQAFPQRSLIIFLGCGVILCTMLISTYVVPLISPRKEKKTSEIEERKNYYDVLSDIFRNVIEELTAQQNATNRRSVAKVIETYQDRLSDSRLQQDPNALEASELRVQAYKWEAAKAMELAEEGRFHRDVALEYVARIERMMRFTRHRDDRNALRRAYGRIRTLLVILKGRLKSLSSGNGGSGRQNDLRELQLETSKRVAGILQGLVQSDNVQTETASQLLLAYQQRISRLRQSRMSVTTSFKINDESEDVQRMAYQIELEQIQKMFEEDRINRQEANRMRDNVFLMQMDLDDNI